PHRPEVLAEDLDQPSEVDGFGQHIGRPDPFEVLRLVNPRRNKDHGNLGELRVALLEEPKLPPADDWHRQVEQNQPRTKALLKELDRFETIAGALEREALVRKSRGQGFAQVGIVLYDEHLGLISHVLAFLPGSPSGETFDRPRHQFRRSIKSDPPSHGTTRKPFANGSAN